MTMSEQAVGSEIVVYPPKCEGVCRLGSNALALIHGVLAGNCRGPAVFQDDTLYLEVGVSGRVTLGSTVESDRGRLACRNPRMVALAKQAMEQATEDLEPVTIDSVRMEN